MYRDTLFIEKLIEKGLCNEFRIKLTDTPHTVIVDSMVIHLTTTSDTFKNLNLKGTRTQFHFLENDKTIDSLKITLDNGSVLSANGSISINALLGEIEENSSLNFTNSKIQSAKIKIGKNSQLSIDNGFYHNPDPKAKLIYEKLNEDDN
ncbi:hypothetical protein DSM03_103148 [Leeuwenhoekiella aestuarii]|uniref:Uncharacterized protein n=1 Tax=Leeuwenhoekiella aestuarii TaxID=2249426 RepID=A0A4Q0NWP9_9FLAO|nr:hypothetical protein [Leeuwenhoekiella aestuarii]RXG15963.1 hypothetical protein DSM03_103148 [Leeuwenhoekiella aestuarii]RXG16657.1 hypothetical protein DSM04_102238 [Leeuwenhoekiella aestuarii]